MDGGTQRIAGDLAVPFGPHRPPDQRRDEVRHPGPAGPLAHPAEHVAVGRAVGELAAVRTGLAQRDQVRVRARRVAGLRRTPAHRALHHPHLGVQLGVGLAERDPGPHVEQMADRGPGVPRGSGLRHVGRHRGGRIEQPVLGQHPGHAADERLRHRHEQVRGRRGHARVVAFGHQLAVVQHDQRVGVGVREHLRRRRRAAVEPPDRRVRQRPGSCGQRHPAGSGGDETLIPPEPPRGASSAGSGGAPPDPPRGTGRRDRVAGDEFAHVPEGPPAVRRVLPVGQGDLRLRRRREAGHEPCA